jgi:hypothetical protein
MPEADEVGAIERTSSTKGRRKAGSSFPVVSLAEVSKILKDAGKYGFDHSVDEFASYMGHTSTNSGAFRQRLAAFRDWKVIAGRGDSIAMTQIGRVIALPPDPDAEREAFQEAFKNCVLFNRLYDEGRKNTPLERQGLGRKAVHSFGVSMNSANKFVESFVESAVVAGYAEEAGDGKVVLFDDEQDVTVPTPILADPVSQGSGPRSSPPSRGGGTPVVHQTWPIGGGIIAFEIRSDKPLPASAYAMVGEVVASLERLARTLGSSADDVGSPTESTD